MCDDRDPRYLYSIDAWVRQRSYTRWALEALDNSLVSAGSLCSHSAALCLRVGLLPSPTPDEIVSIYKGALLCAELCALREL